MTNPIDLAEIKALASKATPGPWTLSTMPADGNSGWKDGRRLFSVWDVDGRSSATTAFITTANPQAILALIAKTEQLAARVQALEAERDKAIMTVKRLEWLSAVIAPDGGLGFLAELCASRRACPCTRVTPCTLSCSCANPLLSGGCSRCCRYGSEEQQQDMAELIAARDGTEKPPKAAKHDDGLS